MKSWILVFFLLFSIVPLSNAQTEHPPSHQNLTEQYRSLIDNSESYNDFKVIRESRLNDFWTVVEDSVNALKNRVLENENQIAQLRDEIASLTATLEENAMAIAASEFENSHIRFLGIDFSKTFFIATTLLVVIGLLILFLIGSFQYNHNRRIAREKLDDFNELESRFDEFRKITLEKQIKLKRELQTDRNKLEEMQSKTTIRKRIPA